VTSDHDSRAKIIHIGKYFPPDTGGMETYLRDLMVASLAMGIVSAALVHNYKSGLKTMHEHHVIDGVSLPITRVASWFRLLFTPISPSFPIALRRLILSYKPDILHLHLPNPSAFWALVLPSSRRLPWVVHWQSDVLTRKSSRLLKICYLLYKPFETALLRRAASIIVTSPEYLRTSQTLLPFRDRCHVVPLGICDRFGRPELNRHAHKNDGPLQVLAIGRLTHYKGFDVLLQAIAQTRDVELDLVGSGEQLSDLISLSRSLGIEKRVRFHGSISDNQRDSLIIKCDCLCLPSIDRTESFGIVLLEAMSASKPCVISDIQGSGITSVVEATRTGLVVPPEDSAALASAFSKFIHNKRWLTEMGARGRERFERQFTIAASTKFIAQIYDDIYATAHISDRH
jgi:glycosyltransferase involved in cell wall biosynthesis